MIKDIYTIEIDGKVLADLIKKGLLRPSEIKMLKIEYKDETV
jgi:hypothetical protein